MISVVRHPWSRGVSWLLCVSLVAPLLLMASPAQAQSLRRVRQLRVVVLDITPVARTGEAPNEALRRVALDAVAKELHTNRHYLPVPDRDLQTELANLNLTPPYLPLHQVRLAQALSAEVILTGYVASQGVRTEGDKRQAKIALQVFLRDAQTGENVNGATQIEVSRVIPGDTRTDEQLEAEAIELAAAAVVDRMSRYEIPQGAVLQARSRSGITINIGSRHGVKSGMRFALLRKVYDRGTGTMSLELAGHISVNKVYATTAECRAEKDAQTVMSEDMVRAIWQEKPMVADQQNPSPSASGDDEDDDDEHETAKILLTVALVGLGVLVAARAMGHGTATAESLRARSSTTAVAENGVWTEALVGSESAQGPGAVVKWAVPAAPSADFKAGAPYIVGYEIHRSNVPGFTPTAATLQAVVMGGHSSEYVDRAGLAGPRALQLRTDAKTGRVNATEMPATGAARLEQSADGLTYEWTPSALTPGGSYHYVVRVICSGLAQAGPGPLSVTRLYDLGPLTCMAAPRLIGATPGTDAASWSFEWEPVAGGDVYVIQVSDTVAFPASRTLTSREVRVTGTDGRSVTRPFDGPSIGQGFGGGARLYWRVGVRSSLSPRGALGVAESYVFSAPHVIER